MTDEGNGPQGPDIGSRRLCAALIADQPGLLAEACRGGRFSRLFLAVLDDGTQAAIAPAGIDELRLVGDLVEAVTARLPDAPDPRPAPTVLALNVGIMRVHDDGFAGAGLDRACILANDSAVRATVGAHAGAGGRERRLAVVLSGGLYTDLYDEGYPVEEWRPVRMVDAWFRWFGARPDREAADA
jgi:hypothetical protein